MYYGRRDLAADSSFITTLWITAAHVPLIPLRFYRVWPGRSESSLFYRSQEYRALPVGLCGRQIVNVYGVLAAAVVFITLVVRLIDWWISS